MKTKNDILILAIVNYRNELNASPPLNTNYPTLCGSFDYQILFNTNKEKTENLR